MTSQISRLHDCKGNLYRHLKSSWCFTGDYSKVNHIYWARFRDDIYLPWTLGEPKLYELLEFLNTRLPGIEFTVEHSHEGIAFLDTFIYSKNNKIHTKIFSKECDDHKFLIPTSYHPTHVLRNIPYNTALRIYKITSDEAEYTKSRDI